jgi:hypothetical protein
MPPEGHVEGSNLPEPFQSLGAKAVNNLSSKILIALFPPNTAFFKLGFDQITQARMEGEGLDITRIQKDLAVIEQTVVSQLEQTRLRAEMGMCIKHLLITGNYVIDTTPNLGFRGFGLNHFAVNRDPEGAVLELVIREEVSPLTLDDETKNACFNEQEKREFSANPDEDIEVFTVQYRDGNQVKVRQEINNKVVPGSEGSYPLDAPRFVALRWSSITDEDYGRGMVDEYYGDILALDSLSRDLLLASSAAAKVIFTVDPNSILTPHKIASAKSGDVLKGNSEEVGTVSVDKMQDFQIVLERLRDIQRDLSEAFLMNTSVQRDAERVTAEEIRFMAQELEDALGGVYSVLAQELQVPLLRRILKLLARQKLIPDLPSDVQLSITTGLEALGRGHEVQKLMQFFGAAAQIIPPEQLVMRIKTQDVLNIFGSAFGLDTESILLTEEEVQAQQQQAMAAQAMQQAAPGVAQEMVRQGGNPNG